MGSVSHIYTKGVTPYLLGPAGGSGLGVLRGIGLAPAGKLEGVRALVLCAGEVLFASRAGSGPIPLRLQSPRSGHFGRCVDGNIAGWELGQGLTGCGAVGV